MQWPKVATALGWWSGDLPILIFFFKPRSATAFASDFEQVISPQFPIYSQSTTATTLLGDARWTYGCEALFLS